MLTDTGVCPNFHNPQFRVDYGIGYGHICHLCRSPGKIEAPSQHIHAHLLSAFSRTFPGYAWTDSETAIDLLVAEISTLRVELGRLTVHHTTPTLRTVVLEWYDTSPERDKPTWAVLIDDESGWEYPIRPIEPEDPRVLRAGPLRREGVALTRELELKPGSRVELVLPGQE